MNRSIFVFTFALLLVAACGPAENAQEEPAVDARGRLLEDDGFAVIHGIRAEPLDKVTPAFRVNAAKLNREIAGTAIRHFVKSIGFAAGCCADLNDLDVDPS